MSESLYESVRKGKPMDEKKEKIAALSQQLIEMTSRYCEDYLDNDYKQLCIKLVVKMSRKRNVPFLSGKIEIWAAAVVYAIGSINFLFDKSFKPFVTAQELCDYFGTKLSTTRQKSQVIEEMFKLEYYDPEFSTKHMMESNPMKDLVMIDGFIVDKKSLSPEMQAYVESELSKKKKSGR